MCGPFLSCVGIYIDDFAALDGFMVICPNITELKEGIKTIKNSVQSIIILVSGYLEKEEGICTLTSSFDSQRSNDSLKVKAKK